MVVTLSSDPKFVGSNPTGFEPGRELIDFSVQEIIRNCILPVLSNAEENRHVIEPKKSKVHYTSLDELVWMNELLIPTYPV